MEIGQQDLIYIENILKSLKKGTFNLEGVEVLALAECMIWLSRVQQSIRQDAQAQEQLIKRQAEQSSSSTSFSSSSFSLEEAPPLIAKRKKKDKTI